VVVVEAVEAELHLLHSFPQLGLKVEEAAEEGPAHPVPPCLIQPEAAEVVVVEEEAPL
jgi:hypothetical protein